MDSIEALITDLANRYKDKLLNQIDNRIEEMQNDNDDHFIIYRVLGVSDKEGRLIDEFQNKGRFLYKYAGSFLEEATLLCFIHKNNSIKIKTKLPNTESIRPRTIEIDCLDGNKAYEIKWRDATTDGDHITKEHTRIKVISSAGFIPIRIMFFEPNRDQAKRIQYALADIYKANNGFYYSGYNAWKYLEKETGIDLLSILNKISQQNK